MPRLLVLHDRPDDFADLLAERCPDLDVAWATAPEQVEPELLRHRPELVLSLKHSGFPGPAHAPAVRFPTVRWLHVAGSGFEHLGSWDPDRVTVTNSSGVLAPFLVETAFAALLSLAVGLPGYAEAQAQKRWAPARFRPVAGRTLLVVGVGGVGGLMAERARAFGMRVLGVRASGEPRAFVDEMHAPGALAALLPRADIVSLHVRLGPETRHLIGPTELGLMKGDALLLNSSRGPVLDESALVSELRSGRLRGVWLDVFEREPLPPDSPLWTTPRVLLTPHCADQVRDFPRRFAELFCELRRAHREGRPLPRQVTPSPAPLRSGE